MDCYGCKPGYEFRDGQAEKCLCPSKTHIVDPVTSECVLCDPKCAECEGEADHCTKCASNYLFQFKESNSDQQSGSFKVTCGCKNSPNTIDKEGSCQCDPQCGYFSLYDSCRPCNCHNTQGVSSPQSGSDVPCHNCTCSFLEVDFSVERRRDSSKDSISSFIEFNLQFFTELEKVILPS